MAAKCYAQPYDPVQDFEDMLAGLQVLHESDSVNEHQKKKDEKRKNRFERDKKVHLYKRFLSRPEKTTNTYSDRQYREVIKKSLLENKNMKQVVQETGVRRQMC